MMQILLENRAIAVQLIQIVVKGQQAGRTGKAARHVRAVAHLHRQTLADPVHLDLGPGGDPRTCLRSRRSLERK